MSYFDFFRNNIKHKTRSNESIRGTCYEMCPVAEIDLREKEGLVHVLEASGQLHELVKCYSRSAADSNMAIPSLLRPFNVLRKTIQHLLFRVTQREDVTLSCLYDFVNDRLRAIRQDMTIQRLPPDECMQLLEPMIRFYVWFGYRLSNKPISEFDPVLNRKYLLECIKWFLQSCNIQERQARISKDDKLTEFFSNWTIDQESDHNLTCDKILIESLYVLCNLDDIHPLYRYLTLQPDIKSAPSLRLAYEIARANLHRNFVRVSRLSERLCPLGYCAFSLYLPTLQRKALQVMSCGYSSRQLAVPVGVVRRWLGFDTADDVVTTCGHYGLQVNDGVRFFKGAFKDDAGVIKPTKVFRTKHSLPFEEILTYRAH